MHLKQKRNSVFYGWWVVGACASIVICTAGVLHFGFTAILEPIAAEFGWSYAQISLAVSIRGLEIGLLAPLMGLLVDRWGPRKLLFGGTIGLGLSLVLLGSINSLGMFYVAFALIAIASSATGPTVTMTAVVNWFRKKVGIATGILASGFGMGGLLVPVVVKSIDMFGWRKAMLIFGLGTWVIVLPLSLLVRHKPEQYGYLPDGEASSTVPFSQDVPSTPNGEADTGTKQILKSSTFWHIALAFMFLALMLSAVLTHIMPYLSSIGMTRSIAGLMASVLPLASIGGRLVFGWLGDRLDKRRVAAIGFALTGLGLLFFASATTRQIWLLVPFLILFGTGWGGNVTMRAALVRERFGRGRFGTVHGFVIGVMMLGNITGAPVAGWVFDTWGSYHGVWLTLAGLAIVAVMMVLTTPPLKATIEPVDRTVASQGTM
ncbi:MFS transporter [Chloroflexota bacterium]